MRTVNAEQIWFVSLEKQESAWNVRRAFHFIAVFLLFYLYIYALVESERTLILDTASGSGSNKLHNVRRIRTMNADQTWFFALESRKVLEMWDVDFTVFFSIILFTYMYLESERNLIVKTASGSKTNKLHHVRRIRKWIRYTVFCDCIATFTHTYKQWR